MGGKEPWGFRGVAIFDIFNGPTEVLHSLFVMDDKGAVEEGLNP